MASENTIVIVGNLTADPELRYTPNGSAVVNFTVAVNRRQRNGDQWEDKLEGFFRCNAWNQMAENVAESLTKGSRVVVTGRLEQRTWETQEGQKRYEIEVKVDEVGPSLKWASASVTKSTSGGSGGSGGGGNFGGGARQPAPAAAQNQGGSAFAAPQAAPQPASGGFGDDDWGSPAVGGGTSGVEGDF